MPVPSSAPHDQITSNALAQLMGKTGLPIFLATGAGNIQTAAASRYCAILFTADTVLSALTFWDNGEPNVVAGRGTQTLPAVPTPVTAMTFPKGTYFAANIHSLTVSSGQCIVFPA